MSANEISSNVSEVYVENEQLYEIKSSVLHQGCMSSNQILNNIYPQIFFSTLYLSILFLSTLWF